MALYFRAILLYGGVGGEQSDICDGHLTGSCWGIFIHKTISGRYFQHWGMNVLSFYSDDDLGIGSPSSFCSFFCHDDHLKLFNYLSFNLLDLTYNSSSWIHGEIVLVVGRRSRNKAVSD